MKNLILILGLLLPLTVLTQNTTIEETNFPYPVSRIYGTDEHSAFTDLIRFNDVFYCSFRVGSDHAGGEDGKVRILRSQNGEQWETVALVDKPGLDLRDPKLSITPDGRIMVIMGGSVYEGKSRLDMRPQVSFSDREGASFSSPIEVHIDPESGRKNSWIWRVTWNNGVGYGTRVQIKDHSPWRVSIDKTNDGSHFQEISQLEVDGKANESTIRFDDQDNMYVIVRREGDDKVGVLAKSSPPYNNWKYQKLDFRLGGPNFLCLNKDKLVVGTRKYKDGVKTQILVTDLDGDVRKTFVLPSGGDTSYPGMLIYNEKLWISYYSSHEDGANIYLTKIPLKDLD
ncbi:hypothetical protein KUV50_00040 [Membranicola marinus]|uniref:Exo-alpha-sialidase n=1 Tax=Membranihabitans marinus TaxID=1227546 RepID=A0A953L5E7_9BACT|nr:hypothetical protein [Membranihabitans marinus]MBY5956502.1 hypothetical protein [Membranihabitans marinus]